MHNQNIIFDNYIFDMDGTLVDSSEEVLLCLKKAFEQANYETDPNRFTSNVIGPPLKEIIKLLAPNLHDQDILDNIMKNFRAIYDYNEDDISVMYYGIYDFLLKLKKQNKRLFIATYKPKIPTLRIIKKFNMNMFEDIYTIDKYGQTITKEEMINDIVEKYNLDKSKTVMLGDAKSDVSAAKAAGIIGIGVLWGYGNDKQPLIENADFTINDIKELNTEYVTN